MSDTPHKWPDLRNDFERADNALIEKVRAFLHGNIAGEIALGELVGHYHAEIAKRDIMLRHELELEDKRCEGCKRSRLNSESSSTPPPGATASQSSSSPG